MIKQNHIYPLYNSFDRKFFEKLKTAVNGKYKFIGNNKEKGFFVKTLLCLQMIEDYRTPLKSIKQYLSPETDIEAINSNIKSKKYELDFSWVRWKHEEVMADIAGKLWDKKIEFQSTESEYDEFILRYMVSIWLVAWEGPLFALLELSKEGIADLNEFNEILKPWDITGIFKNYY